MDPVTLGMIGAAAVGGGLGVFGSQRANRSSAKSAREANQASLQSTREQMAFQERMSSTAYQRSRADMIVAGLNPMLAVSQGGSSSPSGASYSAQSSRRENKLVGLSAAVKDVLTFKAQMSNVAAQNASLIAQANLSNASAKKVAEETKFVADQFAETRAGVPYYKAKREFSEKVVNTAKKFASSFSDPIGSSRTRDNSEGRRQMDSRRDAVKKFFRKSVRGANRD